MPYVSCVFKCGWSSFGQVSIIKVCNVQSSQWISLCVSSMCYCVDVGSIESRPIFTVSASHANLLINGELLLLFFFFLMIWYFGVCLQVRAYSGLPALTTAHIHAATQSWRTIYVFVTQLDSNRSILTSFHRISVIRYRFLQWVCRLPSVNVLDSTWASYSFDINCNWMHTTFM